MPDVRKAIAICGLFFLGLLIFTSLLLLGFRWTTSVSEVSVTKRSHLQQSEFPDVVRNENDWPWWRGPSSNGISIVTNPPKKWDRTNSVVWKVNVPGDGHSSPITWGNEVFVTTSDSTSQTQSVLCFDLKTGAENFSKVVHKGKLPPKHQKNTHASSTPACDQTFLYTAFAVNEGIWVSAIDRHGNIAWQTEAGPFSSHQGFGASLVLSGSNINRPVILNK
jgi:outer membrane protein assembly factor BamB